MNPDDALDAEQPPAPVVRSYRLLAMLSIAAVGAVVLVPYAGLTDFGESDQIRTEGRRPTATRWTAPRRTPRRRRRISRRRRGHRGHRDGGRGHPGERAPAGHRRGHVDDDNHSHAAVAAAGLLPADPEPVAHRRLPRRRHRRGRRRGGRPTPGTSPPTSAAPPARRRSDLDEFFRDRMGPVLGHDYQHVYPLGGDRYLWLFQDTFVDQPGVADELDESAFAHNTAMVQTGRCFTLYHRGSPTSPSSFEPGTGEQAALQVVLAARRRAGRRSALRVLGRDDQGPRSRRPVTDSAGTRRRRGSRPTTRPRSNGSSSPRRRTPATAPIYGYAVASDGEHTYLFGNTFDQNLARQGGWPSGPHSATRMYLARVPLGQLGADPSTARRTDGARDPAAARPISSRFWAENPMQPRFLDGQWVAATKVDGFWGDQLRHRRRRRPVGAVDHRRPGARRRPVAATR